MSKMSKLDSILKEAEEHTKALVSCINEIRELYGGAKVTSTSLETKPTPEPEEKPPTLEEVRAYLAGLATYDLRNGINGSNPHNADDRITKITAVSPSEDNTPTVRIDCSALSAFISSPCLFCRRYQRYTANIAPKIAATNDYLTYEIIIPSMSF